MRIRPSRLEPTAPQRHPVVAVAATYALFCAVTFAVLESRVGSVRVLVIYLPLIGGAAIAGVLFHVRETMPGSRIERFGRIIGFTFVLLVLWAALVWFYIITRAAASL